MSRAVGLRSRILIGLWVSTLLLGDGGTVQFQKRAGPFYVTLFSAPVPLKAGIADLSVLVQTAEDRSEVLDCDVKLTLSKPGDRDVIVHATRAQATNKLLYAASVMLSSAGKWNVVVEITRQREAFDVAGEIDVSPPETRLVTYWPYFAVLPVAITLFILNQRLKQRRRLSSPRARP
ncbi:MAG: hypothetical protein JOY53_02920 [Acidobacteriaceae bacterium]|nr:hypothetical protein [Acidobacteriaceae bacterium]